MSRMARSIYPPKPSGTSNSRLPTHLTHLPWIKRAWPLLEEHKDRHSGLTSSDPCFSTGPFTSTMVPMHRRCMCVNDAAASIGTIELAY